MTASPSIEKTRAVRTTGAAGTRLEWRDVLRVLPTDETRSEVGQRLRDAGFSADSFGTQRIARENVACSLTSVEDALEPKAGARNHEHRASIAAVRRRLEVELWP